MTAVLDRLGRAAEAKARAALIAAVVRDVPDLVASDDPAGVRLRGRKVRGRAFGTRSIARDPRLAAILGGFR